METSTVMRSTATALFWQGVTALPFAEDDYENTQSKMTTLTCNAMETQKYERQFVGSKILFSNLSIDKCIGEGEHCAAVYSMCMEPRFSCFTGN